MNAAHVLALLLGIALCCGLVFTAVARILDRGLSPAVAVLVGIALIIVLTLLVPEFVNG